MGYPRRKEELECGDVMVMEKHERGDEKQGPWGEGVVETHRGMICSRCCVERGMEGEVWCLGCLRMEEGG